MSLRSQRRIAAQVLGVGENRVWINPERLQDVEVAITRQEIRRLVHDGAIKPTAKIGISRVRARIIQEKKKDGLRRGPGTKSGSAHANLTKKQIWMRKIRALRRKLTKWETERALTEGAYRQLYRIAGAGVFSSIADMERYAKAHGLWRKR